jgi:hypothetical protein
LNYNYTKKKIKLNCGNGIIVFGGENLTKGANYLIKKFQKLLIGNISVRDFIDILRETKDKTTLNIYRPIIKKNIEDRLKKIGYWGFIPIPDITLQ